MGRSSDVTRPVGRAPSTVSTTANMACIDHDVTPVRNARGFFLEFFFGPTQEKMETWRNMKELNKNSLSHSNPFYNKICFMSEKFYLTIAT